MILKIKEIVEQKEVPRKDGSGTFYIGRFLAEDEIGHNTIYKTFSKKLPEMIGKEWEGEVVEKEYNGIVEKVFNPADEKRIGNRFEKQFKADPESRKSIERQVCLKEAVNLAKTRIETGDKIKSMWLANQSIEILQIADLFFAWLNDYKKFEVNIGLEDKNASEGIVETEHAKQMKKGIEKAKNNEPIDDPFEDLDDKEMNSLLDQID